MLSIIIFVAKYGLWFTIHILYFIYNIEYIYTTPKSTAQQKQCWMIVFLHRLGTQVSWIIVHVMISWMRLHCGEAWFGFLNLRVMSWFYIQAIMHVKSSKFRLLYCIHQWVFISLRVWKFIGMHTVTKQLIMQFLRTKYV